MLPLSGMKVVDLSSVVFGPLAGQILADYGADVIKVEAPEGDMTRTIGPAAEPGMSAIFLGVNRNKRSIVLDLKRPEARAALHQLLATADVLMHNIRPQKLAALGLQPETLLAANPRLVYAALNGFAEAGPYAGKPAYDDIIQGLAGCAALMELQGGVPNYFPTIAADKICAQVAVHAILAALLGRARTGRGGAVEIPMFETMTAFNLVEHFYGRHFDPPLAPAGYARLLSPWRRPFKTQDSYVCLLPYTTKNWQDFFSEGGRPDLAGDPRFASVGGRTQHIAELYQAAAGIIATGTTEAWLAFCRKVDIPASRVNRLDELDADPHLVATGFFVDVEDDRSGRMRFPGSSVRFDGERAAVRMPPRLGEHTREVLAAAGVSDGEVDALIASGAAQAV
ncbi:CoA transferase [Bradyrhizobium prioriisuperbiae]|uniref:CaiB/BaiF CoA transferase family protein n=1 Tax=Bradyrhizobium prioriisuperbiae TaxID=2854389 RepID=UPI0028F16EC2|nr:CoA transferase [Bradyrhizobium prioritasuperba]